MSESAGNSRVITVAPERLQHWLDGFAARHGAVAHTATAELVEVSAHDGSVAQFGVPFPPLVVSDELPFGGLVAHCLRDRIVAVILVRRGGYAAGVFRGRALIASKVGSRHVQGRSAAGGQSQQRFARRRDKQAREAFEAAANVAARVVLPFATELDAVIVGGDRQAADHVLSDARLVPLRSLVVPPHLPVPDPKLAVLKKSPYDFRAVKITLTEP